MKVIKSSITGYINMTRIKLRSCLLCRELNHNSFDCPFFPNVTPVATNCGNCQDNGMYQFHHTIQDCMKHNFLEKYHQLKEKA